MRQNLIVAAIVSVLMAGLVVAYVALAPASASAAGGMGARGPRMPNVSGFAEGQLIQFIPTEASDPQVARKLTDMMGRNRTNRACRPHIQRLYTG